MQAMSINDLISLTFIIGSILILCTTIIMLTYSRVKRRTDAITRYAVNINATVDESTPELLDMVVSECFDEYMIFNRAYKEKEYINADDETEMTKKVSEMVVKRISPALVDKLSIYYNIDELPNIIASKVYIIVMSYVAENNYLPNDTDS